MLSLADVLNGCASKQLSFYKPLDSSSEVSFPLVHRYIAARTANLQTVSTVGRVNVYFATQTRVRDDDGYIYGDGNGSDDDVSLERGSVQNSSLTNRCDREGGKEKGLEKGIENENEKEKEKGKEKEGRREKGRDRVSEKETQKKRKKADPVPLLPVLSPAEYPFKLNDKRYLSLLQLPSSFSSGHFCLILIITH